MNKIIQKAANKLARPTLHVKKHSPIILFAAGVVGVGATVVLACRATLKLEETLESINHNLDLVDRASSSEVEPLSEPDKKKAQVAVYVQGGYKVAKLYAPAAIVGLASVGALTGAHRILSGRVAGLSAAYAAVDAAFKKYRGKVIAELGKDKDLEFRRDFEDREYVGETPDGSVPIVKTIKQPTADAADMYGRVFDEYNKNWSKNDPFRNQMFIRSQQNWANDMLEARGHVFLNEVYDMLGFKRTKAGAVVGWLSNPKKGEGDGKIDFGVLEGDRYTGQRFINGEEQSVWLDFNVDGVIFDKIEKEDDE